MLQAMEVERERAAILDADGLRFLLCFVFSLVLLFGVLLAAFPCTDAGVVVGMWNSGWQTVEEEVGGVFLLPMCVFVCAGCVVLGRCCPCKLRLETKTDSVGAGIVVCVVEYRQCVARAKLGDVEEQSMDGKRDGFQTASLRKTDHLCGELDAYGDGLPKGSEKEHDGLKPQFVICIVVFGMAAFATLMVWSKLVHLSRTLDETITTAGLEVLRAEAL